MPEIPEELLTRIRHVFFSWFALTGQNLLIQKENEDLGTARVSFDFCMVDDERP
jgi:hypothetical protein